MQDRNFIKNMAKMEAEREGGGLMIFLAFLAGVMVGVIWGMVLAALLAAGE